MNNFVPGEGTTSYLSEFQRGQIVGARLVAASVTTVAQVLGVSRGTVSKVMTAYNVHGTTSSARHNCGRKIKLTARDRGTLKRIVTSRKKRTATKATAEFHAHSQNPVSTHTVRRELHKQHIHGRAAIAKPLVSQMNMKWKLQYGRGLTL
ncbi:helix-turn-helix domain-containing protein [Salmonella enterica subsp. enterica serovar Derby]|nr:helix-turn-helix domain-containing protein [Salmonella enterica subsp. enterica serovar Derby]